MQHKRVFTLLLACNLAAYAQITLKGNISLKGAVSAKAVAVSGGTPTLLASTVASASGGSTATSPDIDCTGATSITITVGNYAADSTAVTITDTQGNTSYVSSTDQGSGGGSWHSSIRVKDAPSVGSMHWTATGGSYVTIQPMCWSGTTGAIDQQNGNGLQDGSGVMQTGSITAATGSLVIVGASTGDSTKHPTAIDNGFTIDQNYIQGSAGVSLMTAYKVLGGAINPQITYDVTGAIRSARIISITHN